MAQSLSASLGRCWIEDVIGRLPNKFYGGRGPVDPVDLEDLLLSTLDAVSRFRVGQREAVGAAQDAGDG